QSCQMPQKDERSRAKPQTFINRKQPSMTSSPTISFAKFAAPKKGAAFALSAEGGGLSEAAKLCDPAGAFDRASPIADFTGKFGNVVDMLAPQGSTLDRLVVLGVGKVDDLNDHAWLKL